MEEDWDAIEENVVEAKPKMIPTNTSKPPNTNNWNENSRNSNNFVQTKNFRSTSRSYEEENWDEVPEKPSVYSGNAKFGSQSRFGSDPKSNNGDEDWDAPSGPPVNSKHQKISNALKISVEEDWDAPDAPPVNSKHHKISNISKIADEEDWDNDQRNPNDNFSRNSFYIKSKKADDEEDWDNMDATLDDSRFKGKRMSEREREEQLFRKLEDMETQKIRNKIKRQLSSRDNESDTYIPKSESKPETAPPTKRLKVSEIFGESESSENEEIDPDISSIDQIESIRISRNELKEWVYMPFFSNRMPGFFVRVNIGGKDSEPIYKIAQIVDVFDQGVAYSVEDVKTSKRLKLSICNRERSFRMSYISNQSFTLKEYDNWTAQHKTLGVPLPKMSELKEKQEDLAFCKNYRLSDSDIDKMVAEKQKFEEIPKNYAILKKKIENDLELAIMEGNNSHAEKLKEELDHAVKEYDKITQRTISRNNVINISNEDRLKEMDIREKLIEQECLIDKDKGDDPFTRRKTAPTMVEFISSATLKESTRARLIANRKNRFQPAVEKSDEKEKSSVPTPQENAIDLRELHNFDLDINIDI